MSSCLSVVRFGGASPDNVPTDLLRKALLQHFEQTACTNVQVHKGSSNDEDSCCAPRLTVSNRYFEAHVLLQEIGQEAPESGAEDDLPYKEDGVILVFDHFLTTTASAAVASAPSPAASFNALEAVHDRAEELVQAGELLRLCVGVSFIGPDETAAAAAASSTKEYEQEYSRRILWCLDRGYEYVEADISETGVATGHDERDKDGFARVVEAVCGTVWSSAVMGSDKTKELKAQYAAATAAASAARESADAQQEMNDYEPPDPLKLPPITVAVGETGQDCERGEIAREAVLGQGDGVADADSAGFLETGQESADDPVDSVEQRQRDREQERVMESFEGMMRQATQIRDQSRSGTLSDDARRQRAGDAADMLMGLMGEMGFDDDDSEGEGGGAGSDVEDVQEDAAGAVNGTAPHAASP